MAATTLSVQQISESAIAPTYNSADTVNGNQVLNPDQNFYLHFKNAHVSNSSTATITAQKTSLNIPGYGDVTIGNISVSLAASSEKVVGPFPAQAYNDANGYVQVSYTGTGTVSVAVLKVQNLVHN